MWLDWNNCFYFVYLKRVFHVQIILFRIKITYNLENQFLQYVFRCLKSIWLWTKERNFDIVDPMYSIVMGTLIHFTFVWKWIIRY